MEDKDAIYGRLWLEGHLSDDIQQTADAIESTYQKNRRLYCQRCSALMETKNQLPSGAYYCRSCIVFGRNQSDRPLYAVKPKEFPKGDYLNWQGQLTTYQSEVSRALLTNMKQQKNSLVHAVTGAGKTEMIYAAIAEVVNTGGWVCLASPRIDVCIELKKRLSRDFSCPVCLMHADSETYHRAPIIVATTHQLMKFYRAFDLLIIDEVDAFPFVGNRSLQYASEQALKLDAVKILLTATSTSELEQQVANKELEKLTLARRFHGKPLIVPEFKLLLSMTKHLNQKKLPKSFVRLIAQQRKTSYPLLIFFPIIELGEQFAELLKTYFPKEAIGYVSSQSENRLETVERFRQGDIGILVSTTILERGVTFPKVDVFVVLANHKVFNAASLIQIAGRVGRSLERPEGQLLFIHEGITKAMKKSVKEIKLMNQKGYSNELSTVPN